MNLAVKSALLSGLVYPGAGHFFLKKYAVCLVLVCAFTLPLLLILSDIVNVAQMLVEQIQIGTMPLDVIEIQHKLFNHIDAEIRKTSMQFCLNIIII